MNASAQAQPAAMKVEIWSDIVCPYCYIGKRKFEAALAQFAGRDRTEVVWKSYQLQPDMPEDYHQTVYELVAEKYGVAPEQSKAMHSQLAAAARAVGLDYQFDEAKPGNTFLAHQLLQFAKAAGRQEVAEEALFHAYFTEGKAIADRDTLLAIGAAIGLDEAALREALDSGTYVQAVKADMAEAQQLGVRGVPFFVLDRTYGVSGAQESPVFLETLEKAFGEWQQAHPALTLDVVEGPSCSPSGECS